MIYDSGEIVTGYRHQFLVKLEWYMTGDFLYQNCFLLLQDETSRLSKFPGANSFHLDSTFQLLEKSELSWKAASLSSAGKLTFHWIHPPHLSWRPKMEATLRLLLKNTCNPCCYCWDKTGIAKCFWMMMMVIRKISEFKVLQPWNSIKFLQSGVATISILKSTFKLA